MHSGNWITLQGEGDNRPDREDEYLQDTGIHKEEICSRFAASFSLVLIATYRTSCQLPYALLKATVLFQGFLISLHDVFR